MRLIKFKTSSRSKCIIFAIPLDIKAATIQKQPPRGVLSKKCSENMQQTYGRIPMPKCGFNKVANWNHTSAWVFFCKFAAYFQNTFFYEDTWVAASERYLCNEVHSLQPFPTIWKLNKNKELTMSTQKITVWGPWGSFTYLASISQH